MEKTIELGRTYRDVITGFFGVATGLCTYITGCDQVLLAPSVKDDGSIIDGRWFDVTRLEQKGSSRIVIDGVDETSRKGADIPAPVK